MANRVFAERLRAIGLEIDHEEVCRDVHRALHGPLRRDRRASGWAAGARGISWTACRREPSKRSAPACSRCRAWSRRWSGSTLPVCVASSGEHEKMRLTLGLTGLLPRFEGRMFSATEVERGKPHPDLFLYAARSLGARPERCVVVEDSLPGVLAARAAGMTAFGLRGRARREAARRRRAAVFHAMEELPELLAETGREEVTLTRLEHHQRRCGGRSAARRRRPRGVAALARPAARGTGAGRPFPGRDEPAAGAFRRRRTG